MGCFTFTLANKKPEKILGGVDYKSSCKLGYSCYAVVVCPDDTHIVEHYYNGYGDFGGHDIYDLVVDWNKNYLTAIIKDLKEKNVIKVLLTPEMEEIAKAFQEDNDEELRDILERCPEYERKEWKRTLGIIISCRNNENIPYPIKIVNNKRIKPYKDLYPALDCQ